ncbi:unnamed protein product [Sphagnum jensenii]|uniref:Uncharacterized protein n=1 Tax=Sphagnum jensenii TaxID=128206 RepID=A0ABP0VH46_9BRYO
MSLAGRSSGGEPPTETEPIHLINPARGGEQFLVVRGDFNQKLKAPLSLNSSRSKRPLRVQLTRGGQQLQEAAFASSRISQRQDVSARRQPRGAQGRSHPLRLGGGVRQDDETSTSSVPRGVEGDVADAGKFVFPGFSLFFRPRSGTVLLLNSSRLSHYTAAVLNPAHCQYGCALYMRRSTQTTYVRRQDRIEQIGDMLDSAMREANVARRRKITAPLPIISENAPPRSEGRRPLGGVLRIKFSPAGVERCEGED